jgi:hypothetical protein
MVALGLGLIAAALLASGLFVLYLNTGREGTELSDTFLIPFSIAAGLMLAFSLAAVRSGPRQSTWLWAAVVLLGVVLWGSLLAALV